MGDTNPTEVPVRIRNPRFYDVKVEGIRDGVAKIEVSTNAFLPTKMQYHGKGKWVDFRNRKAPKRAGVSAGIPVATITGYIPVDQLRRTPIVIGTD